MQSLIRSKSAGVTGGRGTAGAGPGRYLLYWLLFTGMPAQCLVLRVPCPGPVGSHSRACTLRVLRVRCPWPLGARSPVCRLGVLCCVCGGFGHLAPVRRSACVVFCVPVSAGFVFMLLMLVWGACVLVALRAWRFLCFCCVYHTVPFVFFGAQE